MKHKFKKDHTLRGPRIIKTARAIITFAAVVGASVVSAPMSASAQGVEPLDCPPRSTGPIPRDPTPYAGGMCDLGFRPTGDFAGSSGTAISGDGSVVLVGSVRDFGQGRAFRWVVGSAEMEDLGSIDGNDNALSTARAASFNGEVIVGSAQVGTAWRAFRWTDDYGMLDLGTLLPDNAGSSVAVSVSDNGSVIVGDATTDQHGLNVNQAVMWSVEEGTIVNTTLIGALPENPHGGSRAIAVNGDADIDVPGSIVIVGSANIGLANRGFVWIDNGNGVIDLGSLEGPDVGTSLPFGVSHNGRVIVGYSGSGTGLRAVRWIIDADGELSIDNLGAGIATAVSGNGHTAVGVSYERGARAFRWTDDYGILDLGTLRTDNEGVSDARAVNYDGSVIVGSAEADAELNIESQNWSPFRAFRWTEENGMQDLGTLREDNRGQSTALAVSDDGAVVVGYADADGTMEEVNSPGRRVSAKRAFIWRTQMQDFENLMLSFPLLANDTEIAVAQQQTVAGRLMDETCLAEADQSCLTVGGWFTNTGSTAAQDISDHTSGVATLTYGRGIDGQTTLGGTLSLSLTDLNSNAFDLDTGVGVSLWAEYSEGGLSRTGWQAGASIGWGRESGDITRGRGLDNVMLATGETELSTTAVRATLGYGFQNEDWLITPSLTLAHYRTTRSAYAETGADFNATYDALTMERTTATLAVAAEYNLSEQGTLLFGMGLEHDLSADRVTLTGTSTVPGMEDFAVNSTLERRDTRGFLDVGYTHDLGNDRALSAYLRAGQSAFGSAPQVSGGITFSARF
jgi:probable HAF family extracellular repeat protein